MSASSHEFHFDEHQIHALLWYEFKKGNNLQQACQDICKAFGSDVVHEEEARAFFEAYEKDQVKVEKHLPRRPSTHGRHMLNDEKLKELIEKEPGKTLKEYAEEMGFAPTTVGRHLRDMKDV